MPRKFNFLALLLGLSATTCLPSSMCRAQHDDSPTSARANLQSYQEFVKNVGNDIVKILADRGSNLDERRERFRAVLKTNFDIRSIGRFVLARHWRTLNDEQRSRFLNLFENALVENYASQFDNYNNESLEVKGARGSKEGGVIVQTEVIRPQGGKPLNVDWKVFHTKDGSYKILDIVIDGVSLSNTQRSTYAATIQNNNGRIEALLESMEDKNFAKSLNAQSSNNS